MRLAAVTYGGYVGLVSVWMRLTSELFRSQARLLRPMPLSGVLMLALGCVCLLRALFRNFFEQLDDDQDGNISLDEWSRFLAKAPRWFWQSVTGSHD